MDKLHLDFELRSALDLEEVGAARYARHPSTRVLVASFAFGRAPVQRWYGIRGELFPLALIQHVAAGGIVGAHNATFEREIWNVVLPRMGVAVPELRLEQLDCTMARSFALALPGKLEKMAAVLTLHHQKDMEGHRVMQQIRRPRKRWPCERCFGAGCVHCEGVGECYEWWDDPVKLERVATYCDQDVEVEREADEKLLPLTPREREIWIWNEIVNQRGVPLDLELLHRADALARAAYADVDASISELTGGAVRKASDINRLVAWLQSRGVQTSSVAKQEHDNIIAEAERLNDPDVREAIELRRDGSKSSTKKLAAALVSQVDGRGVGWIQYHRATTGRFAGRVFQPHNLPRLDYDKELPHVMHLFKVLEQFPDAERALATMKLTTGAPLFWLSKALRPFIKARKGHRLLGADFSNIEGRVSAWLAGEDWKLEAFREYDAGVGPDLYVLAYSRTFGVPLDQVTKPLRQIGKVEELAFGFQGHVGAFVSMGVVYGVKPKDVADVARKLTPDAVWERARIKFYERDTFGLTEHEWVGCCIVVDGWREAHPKTVSSWWAVQDAVIEAVDSPGRVVVIGKLAYLSAHGFLWCRLPSGRLLAYAKPRIRRVATGKTDRNGKQLFKYTVFCEAEDSETKQWREFAMYAGLEWENAVQAAARDALTDACLRLEANGYPIVLHVHDEALIELPIGQGDVRLVELIMEAGEPWTAGLPVAAAGWEAERYVK